MKRILVVDESRAVRETLSLILGQDFEIVQSTHLSDKNSSYSSKEVDLLILGLPSEYGNEVHSILRFASRFYSPILYLVDSSSSVSFLDSYPRVNFLAKPFNPYELKEKVALLLAQAGQYSEQPPGVPSSEKDRITRYLEFPYLPEGTAALARRFALSSFPLLILGEMGCGQERVARAIYSLNSKAGPWIPVFLAEISEGSLLQVIDQSTRNESDQLERLTLFFDGLEGLQSSGQAALLRFLVKEEERGRELWILSSSRVDLLEKVYHGEFLDTLYYRLATLTLRLPPLRARQGDLPSLAGQVAQEYGERINLGKVGFSPDAIERLCNYLWFGNVKELETVIAKTLAIHRNDCIEAQDLLLGDSEEWIKTPLPDEIGRRVHSDEEEGKESSGVISRGENRPSVVPKPENGHYADFRVLIHELAHELKNPMVTIKTFTQLLKEKFNDASFRSRYQEMVGSDIERMDDLLEALLDFSKFNHPTKERVVLYGQLRSVLEEIFPEWGKRNTAIRWERRGDEEEVFVDQAHLRYVFKNVVLTALAQIKPMSEIMINVEKEGKVTLSYAREGNGMTPLSHYLGPVPQLTVESLPLRILLAKMLLERSGGDIEVHHVDEGKVQIKMVLSTNQLAD